MNKTFKIVFNKARKAMMVCDEKTLSSHNASTTLMRTTIALATGLISTGIATASDVWQVIDKDNPIILTDSNRPATENYDIKLDELTSGQEGELFGTIDIRSKNTVNIRSSLSSLAIKNETITPPKTKTEDRAAVYIKS